VLSLENIGGVQQVFTEYIESVGSDSGIEHYAFSPNAVDNYYKSSCAVSLRSVKGMLRFMDLSRRPDNIVHLYNNASRKVNFALKFISAKVVYHERGRAWNISSVDKDIYSYLIDRSSFFIANSNATRLLMKLKFGLDEEQIQVVHNGIVDRGYCSRMREQSDVFKVGFIGRLNTPKGVEALVGVSKRIGKLKDVELSIAGDGPMLDYLKNNSGVNTFFHGRVGDPQLFISNLDVLIVPSIREPLGNVCIEAGMVSVPVIASNIDGIPEIVRNNEDGILLDPKKELDQKILGYGTTVIPEWVVSPNQATLIRPAGLDPDEVVDAIMRLKRDEDLRARLGKSLRRRVQTEFSIERYSNDLDGIYRFVR